MWMSSVLCLVLFFAFCLCVTALCFALLASLRFAVFAFHDKFYPLSYPFEHLCLRFFSLSRLSDGVKS